MEEMGLIYGTYFGRITLALLLGVLLGTERQITGKTAGIKTHGLVSMGASLFVIISLLIAEQFQESTVFDPLRVASHIIVGVGFIGGGTIFIKGGSISGLTTAANLWVAAGIGMAVGFGLYPLAIGVTLLTLLVFIITSLIEKKLHSKYKDDQ
jgi:putative Mg2+ transporter-C (MgtC) family protein